MPKVFANAQVAHVWAQLTQNDGRSHNGNASFEGRVFYSYSTPIAHIVDSPARGNVVLVTSESFSATTNGKHKPAVRSAVRYRYFSVPALLLPAHTSRGWSSSNFVSVEHQHAANLAHFRAIYDAALLSARRCSDARVDGHIQHASRAVHDAAEYSAAFELPAPVYDTHTDYAAVRAFRAEREARNNTPAKVAARERAAANREAREAAATARAIAENATALDDWRAGLRRWLPFEVRHDAKGGALIRIDGDVLQTSLGAEVPLSHAIRIFEVVRRCKEAGEAWERNSASPAHRVGHFSVDAINADGSFIAGCHRFNWPEVERAAIAAGVFQAD